MHQFNNMLYEQKFLLSLFLTLIIEVPVVFVLVRYFFKYKDIKTPTIIYVGVLATALTIPYLWFVLPAFIFSRITYLILGEFLVILVETFIYKQFLELKLPKAFVVSLIANVASILLGLMIQ